MTSDTMKKPLAVLLATAMLSAPAAGISPFAARTAAAQEYGQKEDRYSKQQLENLMARVALYPDPLLAQILVAATFDEEIEEASRLVRRHRNLDIDGQPWDVSVKAVAHYPTVIHMMADDIDWTVAIGQAYVEQPEDVMAAVQFLRRQAHRAGNLVSNDHHRVIVEREYVEIVPYRPNVIFVPVYEPEIVFFRPAAVITFGVAFPIGVWLIHDFDWQTRRVYYHGWRGDRPWIVQSRPHVRITNVYVNNRYTTVNINRTVVRRNVNVTKLSRFNTVNREVNFTNVERRNQARGAAGDVRGASRREGAEKGQPAEKGLQKDRERGRAGDVRASRREGAEKGQPVEKGLQKDRERGRAGISSGDVKQKDSSPREPDKRLQTSIDKTQEGSAVRQKSGRDAQDRPPRRVREGKDGPAQQFDKGGQAAREGEPRAQKSQAQQGKQQKQEKKQQDKQGRGERE
jgi:hypothetical protein